jgi:uncharacterized DUF497 family protein
VAIPLAAPELAKATLTVYTPMDILLSDFEWDEATRQSNSRKHSLDPLRGIVLFDGRPLYTYASPREGEVRFVGRLDASIVALVWTERPPQTRLISLRRGRDAERRAYQAGLC